jgi:hypothetical protein
MSFDKLNIFDSRFEELLSLFLYISWAGCQLITEFLAKLTIQ